MQLFFCNNFDNEIKLSNEESRHAIKVLRKDIGDKIYFTNGKGLFVTGEIKSIDKLQAIVKILSKERKLKSHDYILHVGIAPTKNIDRFEWFLEKATEIGIDEITPIICERSERKVIKLERCKRILKSAMKQSLKFHLPKINNPTKFRELITDKNYSNKYIAHCNKENTVYLKDQKVSEDTLILIGPEGDFSMSETNYAIENNFKEISLGKDRYRTETAGVISTHIINLRN
jgi:16S rRNA (uracil1498-N3)-methyltransferase